MKDGHLEVEVEPIQRPLNILIKIRKKRHFIYGKWTFAKKMAEIMKGVTPRVGAPGQIQMIEAPNRTTRILPSYYTSVVRPAEVKGPQF